MVRGPDRPGLEGIEISRQLALDICSWLVYRYPHGRPNTPTASWASRASACLRVPVVATHTLTFCGLSWLPRLVRPNTLLNWTRHMERTLLASLSERQSLKKSVIGLPREVKGCTRWSSAKQRETTWRARSNSAPKKEPGSVYEERRLRSWGKTAPFGARRPAAAIWTWLCNK